jgi:hypothetical protein
VMVWKRLIGLSETTRRVNVLSDSTPLLMIR